MIDLNKRGNKLLYRIVQAWRSCGLYAWIDRRISRKMQKRLHVADFTILSSNCIGGTIYHRFGRQFKSPTVNVCFTQPDFAQFVIHLAHYLAQPLSFFDAGTPYPTAILNGDKADIPDIRIDFNHYADRKTAEEKWEERKKRIDYEHLYIILYKLDGLSMELIRKLETVPCSNKVLLTAKPMPEVSWSYCIKPNPHQQYSSAYLGKDLLGRRWYEKRFDVAAFLNQGETQGQSGEKTDCDNHNT